MTKYIFDVEFYPNYFEVGFKEFGKDNYHFFEINDKVNDREKLIKFLAKKHILIGFNSIHYDNLMLNCVIKHKYNLLHQLQKLNDAIISDDFTYKQTYKFKKFESVDIDLYSYWSRMLRISKKISLKGLMVQLNMPTIQELPYKPSDYLSYEQMELVKQYNVNDLQGTEKLCKAMEKDIKLRFNIKKERGFNCYSWDAIKLASEELLQSYVDQTGKNPKEIRNLRFEKPTLYIKDLLREINFDFKTETFKNLLDNLNNSVDTFKEKVLFNCKNTNILLSYGKGGIHSVNKNQVFKTTEDKQLLTSDVASLYPTLIINYKLIRFPEVLKRYSEIKAERLLAKHGKLKGKNNELYNLFYKLVLNGVSGLLDNEHSWLYYPEGALKLRLIGQLLLTKLIEKAALADFEVVSANTDGIEVLVEHNRREEYEELVKKVEALFDVEFEHENYKRIYYWSVNDYIAIITDDYAKEKGLMVNNPVLSNSVDYLIIPKALRTYFMNGTPIEKTIKNEKDIFLFCAAPKAAKTFTVWWKGEKQQRLNRFFVSKSGAYLYKQKEGENPHNMLKGYTVELLNRCTDTNAHNYDINYGFYISKCKELIDQVEPKQLSLF